jgi:hypothetical protein
MGPVASAHTRKPKSAIIDLEKHSNPQISSTVATRPLKCSYDLWICRAETGIFGLDYGWAGLDPNLAIRRYVIRVNHHEIKYTL